ncbi:semaphorin-4D-like [Perognathus longimembris pacificus]|uniref:semaphorin-4D-like n=1 Tax=Perognathus longimembris pacificus TaxID=214514 RepID=UPI002018B9D3|nr:semaphorin-4D-like [Perognathus longimembris pacificus]
MRMPCLVGGLITALVVMFGTVTAYGPVPRINWNLEEVDLMEFQEPGIFNYSLLLLSEDQNTLYVGAREAVFALNALNISQKQNEVYWKVSEDNRAKCLSKDPSKGAECFNFIRVLQPLNDKSLYVCGTNAYRPKCDHLNLADFKFQGLNEDGRGKSPYSPTYSSTSVMLDGQLFAGTSTDYFGELQVISRYSHIHPVRTEYDTNLLYEPNFVFADVIRKSPDSPQTDNDKVYFFFTEVPVEYDFFSKLKIPRVARVCKGDVGGQRDLQKRWTSFLKAKLICSQPDLGLIFNTVQDVFVLQAPDLKEPIFYALFTLQMDTLGLVQLSAVCAYTQSKIEEVFSQGKYMGLEVKWIPKWVPYNGPVPTPQPGACTNREARGTKYLSSLDLPDETVEFVRDHPLMDDSITPINNKTEFIKKGVNYTQIVVDRTQALDGKFYDVMFVSTDQGTLHKIIRLENIVYMIEETQIFQKSGPVQTLVLSSKKGSKFIYAGSNAGVVQVPLAFCRKHSSCKDCVLARDPYCAWNPTEGTCEVVHEAQGPNRYWIQDMSGNVSSCPGESVFSWYQHFSFTGSTAYLRCSPKSNKARVIWKFQNRVIGTKEDKYIIMEKKNLLITKLSMKDQGRYQCLSEEWVNRKAVTQVLNRYILEVKLSSPLPCSTGKH